MSGFCTTSAMALNAVSARSLLQILAVRERADAQGVAVGREHRNAFAHVLRGRAVHHGAETSFELPRALARRDHERRATQLRHASLERRQRAQRRVEEHEPENLARERLRLRLRFQPAREIEQVRALRRAEGRRDRRSVSW